VITAPRSERFHAGTKRATPWTATGAARLTSTRSQSTARGSCSQRTPARVSRRWWTWAPPGPRKARTRGSRSPGVDGVDGDAAAGQRVGGAAGRRADLDRDLAGADRQTGPGDGLLELGVGPRRRLGRDLGRGDRAVPARAAVVGDEVRLAGAGDDQERRLVEGRLTDGAAGGAELFDRGGHRGGGAVGVGIAGDHPGHAGRGVDERSRALAEGPRPGPRVGAGRELAVERRGLALPGHDAGPRQGEPVVGAGPGDVVLEGGLEAGCAGREGEGHAHGYAEPARTASARGTSRACSTGRCSG
jgi:hypothetical protein